MFKAIFEKITKFLHKPWAFLLLVGTFSISITGALELIRISCVAARDTSASVCFTTNKSIYLADSVSTDKCNALKLNLGEVVCDHDLTITKHDMEIQAMIDPKLEAKLRPVWVRDSIFLTQMQKKLGLRK